MITTIPPQTNEMSTVDALWVLIQSQTKAVQKALIQRILASQTSEKTKAQQKMVKERERYIMMPASSLQNEGFF